MLVTSFPGFFAMLSSSSSSAEIVKINSRPLESGELKRLDKQEKECIAGVVGVVKGKKKRKAQYVQRKIDCHMSSQVIIILGTEE